MAIYLKNSAFIHIVKTGGITVGKTLRQCANIVKDHKPEEAHLTPDVGALQPFAFVRHPATWLRSLFQQRQRRKQAKNVLGGKVRQWNWDDRFTLERECKSRDFNEFFDNVVSRDGLVSEYFDHYTNPYNNILIGKLECLTEDLIDILRKCDEIFDERKLRFAMNTKHNMSKTHHKLTNFMLEKMYYSNQDFYNKYKYGIIPSDIWI